MLFLVEFSPLLAFGIAYKLGGIYTATAVLMAAMVVTLLIVWKIRGRIPPVNGISTLMVLVLGSATLLLRNVHFIQWKPSAFLWLIGAVFLGSAFIGQRTLAQRMLGDALAEVPVTPGQWQWANAACVLFCLLAGIANLAVAFHAPEAAWVRFKLFGLPLAMFLFIFAVAWWLHSRPRPPSP
jgi:intracellular septation protein